MHVVERVLAVGCVRGRHLSDFASPRRVTAWGRLQSGAGGCARGAIKTRASETPRAPRSARRLQVPNPFPILTSSHEGWCGDSATKATAGFACTVPVCPTGSPAGLVVVSFFFLLHQLMLRSCCCCVRVVLDHRLGSVGTRGARPASRNWRANIQRPNTSTYGHAGARRPDLASFPREEPALLPTMCRSTISWWEDFARPEAVQPLATPLATPPIAVCRVLPDGGPPAHSRIGGRGGEYVDSLHRSLSLTHTRVTHTQRPELSLP